MTFACSNFRINPCEAQAAPRYNASMIFSGLVFAAATASASLTPVQIDRLVVKAEMAFNSYIFPSVAVKAVAALKGNTTKYEAIHDPKALAVAITADLYSVTHDKHVGVWFPYDGPPDSSKPPTKQQIADDHRSELAANFGFETVRRPPGNVGYVDFRFFSGDPSVAQTIAGTMAFLANTDALIFDLRKNGGGSPMTAETLEAYLFADQQQITSLKIRDPKTGVIRERQQYTDATVPGPRYLDKPIYVLTSSRTFSCAEQFTYDLRNLKRITVVGETTGGGANPGGLHALGNHMAIFIPDGMAYSPVTKTNWEGTGIALNVAVPSTDALAKAYALALSNVVTHTQDSDLRIEAQAALKDETKALAPQP